jgi:hypothetical protein
VPACLLFCLLVHTPLPPCPPYSFFEDYKKNENKLVVVDEFLGREDAHRIIKDSMAMYQVGGRQRGDWAGCEGNVVGN